MCDSKHSTIYYHGLASVAGHVVEISQRVRRGPVVIVVDKRIHLKVSSSSGVEVVRLLDRLTCRCAVPDDEIQVYS